MIEKALAGEEVILTPPGLPLVELRTVAGEGRPNLSNAQWMERLSRFRESGPTMDVPSIDIIRAMRDEGP